MASWEWRRSVTFSAILMEVAADHGLTLDECLRDTGIEPLLLKTPGAEITAAQEMALARNIVDALGDRPGVGLQAGAHTPVTATGIFAMALLSSPTRRAGVDIAMRYFSLMVSLSRAWHLYRDNQLWLYVDDHELPYRLRGFLLERDVAFVQSNWLRVFGFPPPVLRMEIGGGLRPRLAPILERFEVPATDCEGPHITVFDTSAFDKPMPQANALTAALFDEQCTELLRRRGLMRGTSGSVREVLLHRLNGRVTQEDVAATLHMSLRTMRRRLAEEGTSYRELCVDIYGTLAEELLATGLTVEDVAYRMGYSGAPSFSNAFKQWRGTSPGRFARGISDRTYAPASTQLETHR
ncbi:AraC family transcriptional regulator ligand-binding domain-containing protein [Nocardia sp. NPDC052566]|uniref:AraC family transcriptional regulator ligand-binding domain-containing protein n=1 Tax=Nocardia sp. NPDC052566 TaxID=3364330 RepID=UPI0037C624A2